MSDSSPHGSTGAQPSAEAIEAADAALDGMALMEDALAKSYAIDAPAIHAVGVEEGRAAMLREVVEWAREEAYEATCFDYADVAEFYRRAADAIEARFPSEGTT